MLSAKGYLMRYKTDRMPHEPFTVVASFVSSVGTDGSSLPSTLTRALWRMHMERRDRYRSALRLTAWSDPWKGATDSVRTRLESYMMSYGRWDPNWNLREVSAFPPAGLHEGCEHQAVRLDL